MNMSEVFDLPVSVDGFNLNDGYIGGVGGMTIANFDYEFVSTLSASMAEHSAHAINNHDRMVEENKKLRDFAMYCQGFLGCEESRDSIALHGITINAKDLLAKLNQEGEE